MLSRSIQRVLPWTGRVANVLQSTTLSTSAAVSKPPDPEPVPISKLYDNFLDGTSSAYLEDPSSVDKSWASFFSMASTLAAVARHATHTLTFSIILCCCFINDSTLVLQIKAFSLTRSRKHTMSLHRGNARRPSCHRSPLPLSLIRPFRSLCGCFS
jgi:hypothetical protein